jgi:AraC family transcriptional regulator of adaptative response/methylated-DNA-[protein]-cysteine methyltransferase
MNRWRATLVTSWGGFVAEFSERGLTRLSFPGRAAPEGVSPARLPRPQRGWAALTARALARALAGRAADSLPPFDEAGTAFQRAVWRALRTIPPGQTRTYAEVARALGRPAGAARAVGQACGANPIPVLTPCHRVLAAGGRLGGFSAGLEWKRRLLAAEAAGRGVKRTPGSKA